MKRTLFFMRMMASLVMSVVTLVAAANEYIDPQSKVVYTYEPGSGTAMVKAGYEDFRSRGEDYELESAYHPGSPDAAGDVAILDRFTVETEEYVVTSIGELAFSENENITSVSIPESVTVIEDMAFSYCTNLIAVQLPEGLTQIAPALFMDCNKLMSVVIPSSVCRIESSAFAGCRSLASITLPAGLTYAGVGALNDTPWYASLYDEAPDGPFYIGPLLLGYKGDKPTGELVIKEGTTCVGYGAFHNCKDLTSITIPRSVVSVDYNAFQNCSGLTAVYITDLAAWCGIEFKDEGLSRSSNPLYYAHHLYLDGKEVTNLVIPESVTTIGSYAFDNCTALTSVTIPDGVTSVGTCVFRKCSNLASVTIPPSMATIGNFAFLWCFELEAVHISDLAAWGRISFNDDVANPLYYGAHLYLNDMDVTDLIIQPKDYRPLVEEGKHWTYSSYMPVRPAEYNHYYYYDLKGDTLIAGKNCLKMYSDNRANDGVVRYEAALYEENKKVFCFFPEKEEAVLLYDFDCEVGDTLNVYKMQMVVTDIQPAILGDMIIRKYILQPVWDEPEDYGEVIWIEGVGATKDFFGMLPKPGNYNSLYACELNGENLLPEPAYRPFIEEGKVWKVGGDEAGNPVRRVEYYYFDGDTIIDGKTCKQMMCQRYVSPEHPDYNYTMFSQMPSLSYVGAWYEEDRKVYVYDDTNKQFQLMYDFSLEANGTMWINDGYHSYVAGPRQTGGFNGFKGVYRNVVMYDGGSTWYSLRWLEGVGTTEGPGYTISYRLLFDYPNLFLMSCTVGDEIIYLNDDYEDGATPKISDAQNRRIDFTHTIKTKPKAPFKRETSDAPIKREAEQSLYGEYNELQLGINLDPLADVYLVGISDETGKTVYEKTIDAGAIVGLNIDISAYEEGLYTITLDNSRESFTGAFEVRTTGIASPEGKDFFLLQEGKRTAIYNLQGQRISSLRKGLNIVNGRKVYVK